MLHFFNFSIRRLIGEMKTIKYQFTNGSIEQPLLAKLKKKKNQAECDLLEHSDCFAKYL